VRAMNGEGDDRHSSARHEVAETAERGRTLPSAAERGRDGALRSRDQRAFSSSSQLLSVEPTPWIGVKVAGPRREREREREIDSTVTRDKRGREEAFDTHAVARAHGIRRTGRGETTR